MFGFTIFHLPSIRSRVAHIVSLLTPFVYVAPWRHELNWVLHGSATRSAGIAPAQPPPLVGDIADIVCTVATLATQTHSGQTGNSYFCLLLIIYHNQTVAAVLLIYFWPQPTSSNFSLEIPCSYWFSCFRFWTVAFQHFSGHSFLHSTYNIIYYFVSPFRSRIELWLRWGELLTRIHNKNWLILNWKKLKERCTHPAAGWSGPETGNINRLKTFSAQFSHQLTLSSLLASESKISKCQVV